jgi:hypothetical protein
MLHKKVLPKTLNVVKRRACDKKEEIKEKKGS